MRSGMEEKGEVGSNIRKFYILNKICHKSNMTCIWIFLKHNFFLIMFKYHYIYKQTILQLFAAVLKLVQPSWLLNIDTPGIDSRNVQFGRN